MATFDFLRDILFKLTPYLPGIVGVLLILALVLIGTLLWLVRRARDRARAAAPEGETAALAPREREDDAFAIEPDDLPVLPLKKSFKLALKILRTHVSGRDWRYAIPWYLLIGPEGSGKSTLAAATGMNLPVGAPAADWEDVQPGCKWWFFDRGILLDVAGNFIRLRHQRGSSAKGWRLLLSLMDRYRPRRPADGIVLTLPVDDLIDGDGAPREPDDVAHRADAVYKKLWQAQARLGLAFPVYVMVTKADRLTGFKPFVQALPGHHLDGMLGWSNPYNFDSRFRSEWVGEAMAAVDDTLNAAQLELFSEIDDAGATAEMVRLPEAFAALGENLTIYLSTLFKDSAYHEAFALRGLYFTGDGGLVRDFTTTGLATVSGAYSGPEEEHRAPVFLRDLFDRKIFAERGLARPARRALLARNRSVLAAQAASLFIAVAGGLGLWYATSTIRTGVASVEPFVEEVRTDLREAALLQQETGGRGGGDRGRLGSFDREKAINLLDGMTRVKIDSFQSVLVPTSWGGSLDSDVVAIARKAFDHFILQSMRARLDEKGRNLVAGRLPQSTAGSNLGVVAALGGGPEDEGVGVLVNDTPLGGPAFARLRDYVEALRAFENALVRFNGLHESRDLADVKALVLYLFDTRLPENFLEHSTFYQSALSFARNDEIPKDLYDQDAKARYTVFERAALAELYAENPLLVALRSLGLALDEAANRHAAGIGTLVTLKTRIDDAQRMLDAPEIQWMGNPAFDPTAAFSGLLERIGGSAMLGPRLAAAFNTQNKRGVEDVRLELPDLQSLVLGPLLKQNDGGVELAFAAPIGNFKALTVSLFAEPFMAEGRTRPLPVAPAPGSGTGWNLNRLTEAVDLIGAYDSFMRERLGEAPTALHGLIRTAAGQRLETVTNDRIAAALESSQGALGAAIAGARAGSGLAAEDRLRREISSLSAAAPSFVAILEAYDTLGLEDSYLDLTDMVMTHGLTLLEETDDLFGTESLYQPVGGDLSWWDGADGMALRAFRASDPFDLREVLGVQRSRIGVLAQDYAKPVLDLIDARDVRLGDRDRGLVRKWRRILDEIQKVQLSKPDNSITTLERFITGEMMQVAFANCGETLGEDDIAARGDYFTSRLIRLKQMIRTRCTDLAEIEAQTAYAAIAQGFAEHLEGRYPFTDGFYRDGQREASPRDLRRFFRTFDDHASDARSALNQADGLGPNRERALDFLARMDRVRAVFAPWLASGSETDSPVFDLALEFQVNRQRERGGNQVIAWRFGVDDRDVSNLSADKTLRWSLDERIDVDLRWANDAVRVPAQASDRTNVAIQGKRATFSYENAWSLFELIRRHRAGSEDFAEFVDPLPHTLRFRVPTRPAAGGPVEDAILFIRVHLSALAEGEPVDIEFPVPPTAVPRLAAGPS